MSDATDVLVERAEVTLLVSAGTGQTAIENFTAALFSLCNHERFRHAKPPIESRIYALRFAADTLEAESRTS